MDTLQSAPQVSSSQIDEDVTCFGVPKGTKVRLIELDNMADSWIIVSQRARASCRYKVTSEGRESATFLKDNPEYVALPVSSDIKAVMGQYLYVGVGGKQNFKPIFINVGTDLPTSGLMGSAPVGQNPDLESGEEIMLPHWKLTRKNAFSSLMELASQKADFVHMVGDAKMKSYHEQFMARVQSGLPPQPLETPGAGVVVGEPDSGVLSGTHPHLSTTAADGTVIRGWAYPILRLPVLAAVRNKADFAPVFMEIIRQLPTDILGGVFMLSMILLWCRLKNEPKQQEDSVLGFSSNNRECGLRVFLVYAPHFFRLHEQYELSVYGDISTIIQSMYIADVAGGIYLEDGVLEKWPDPLEDQVLELYKYSGLDPNEDWLAILPPSMPGSHIPQWRQLGMFKGRDAAIHKALGLPDIHTLGFPLYPLTEVMTRKIIRPKRDKHGNLINCGRLVVQPCTNWDVLAPIVTMPRAFSEPQLFTFPAVQIRNLRTEAEHGAAHSNHPRENRVDQRQSQGVGQLVCGMAPTQPLVVQPTLNLMQLRQADLLRQLQAAGADLRNVVVDNDLQFTYYGNNNMG